MLKSLELRERALNITEHTKVALRIAIRVAVEVLSRIGSARRELRQQIAQALLGGAQGLSGLSSLCLATFEAQGALWPLIGWTYCSLEFPCVAWLCCSRGSWLTASRSGLAGLGFTTICDPT